MTAYKKEDLYHAQVQELAHEAFTAGCIGEDSYRNILRNHPVHLYTPNYFIRIGLTLLTLVCILFSAGLFGLFFQVSGESGFIAGSIMMSLACYGFLELIIKAKNYYNAGIDNARSAAAFLFMTGAFFILSYPHKEIIICLAAFVTASWLCIRFADAFMGLIAYLAFLLLAYFVYISMGYFFRETAPLLLMLLSALCYRQLSKFLSAGRFMVYQSVLQSLRAAALISFYVAGNYYIAMLLITYELDAVFTLHKIWAWLCWIFTLAMPLAYIIAGVRKKDILWIRTGLCLIAVAVFTFRNYYHVLDAEKMMVLAGIIMTGASYLLIRYLRTPQYGFTAEHTNTQSKAMQQAEALIIAQSLGKPAAAPESSGVHFGGGSGGGGGATGSY
ncbi:hypothetical protein ACTHGU_17760 [Chitinophagaceae bacterium MMS25-I14]